MEEGGGGNVLVTALKTRGKRKKEKDQETDSKE